MTWWNPATWWAVAKPAGKRSSRWPAVRAAFLLTHPECAACGGTKVLEVHHVLPFHVRPDLELSNLNLLTLCEAPGRNCHFAFGHLYDWQSWNVDAEADAEAFRRKRETRP